MRRISPAAAGVGFWLLGGGVATAAADPFALAPADDPAVVRGREVAERFDLLSVWEVSFPVDPAPAPTNAASHSLGDVAGALARLPGVRWVQGPSSLLDAAPDVDGAWFGAADERTARLLIAAWAIEPVRVSAADAIRRGSLSSSSVTVAPLWPDPSDWVARWGVLLAGVIGVAFVWLVGGAAWKYAGGLSRGGAVAVMGAAAVGAAAPYAMSALPALQAIAWLAGAGAAATAGVAVSLEKKGKGAAIGGGRARPVPMLGLVTAMLLVGAGMVTLGRVRLQTQQWRAAPLLFVSVRGDLDQPVALRELRRLTDHLRAQPGVADAWSVADLFQSVPRDGDPVGRIPDSVDDVHRILIDARHDPAVRLGLSGDFRDALIAVRFDPATAVDRPRFVDRLGRHLQAEWRRALLPVDLRGEVPDDTRALARGVLANDVRARILWICERAGRNLAPPEQEAIARASRQAALIPAVDAPKLRAEVTSDVQAFLRQPGAPPLTEGERERVARALAAVDGDSGERVVAAAVVKALDGHRGDDERLVASVPPLARLLARTRLRHLVRMSYREILTGAGLPADGELADQVRVALRDAMGPMAGLPVTFGTPGALALEAVVVGGAANDRALSRAWLPGLAAGAQVGAALLAIILLLVAGWRGLLWWPFGLAVPAAALIVPALARASVGLLFVALLSAAGTAGATLVVSLAARRTP